MINEAQVCFSGFVASEPVFKHHDSGVTSAKMRVAYTGRRRSRDTGEWSDGPTTFLTVVCWRTLAENIARCVHKGEPVMVQGRLQVRRFQNAEGKWREVAEVDASSIGHDLSRGVALFSRTWKAAGVAAAEIAAGMPVTGPADGEDSEPASVAGAAPLAESGENAADVQAPGSAVIDERAVARFAAELDESLPTEPEPEPEPESESESEPSLA
jgi:single-strand DNA-binding protein